MFQTENTIFNVILIYLLRHLYHYSTYLFTLLFKCVSIFTINCYYLIIPFQYQNNLIYQKINLFLIYFAHLLLQNIFYLILLNKILRSTSIFKVSVDFVIFKFYFLSIKWAQLSNILFFLVCWFLSIFN